MKYYSIGEFAEKIGKTIQTLRNWDKNGSLKPSHITDGGTRYYSQEQLNHFLGIKGVETKTKIENLCNKYGTTIEIIDNTEKTEEQELVEDLIQIVTVCSCRLQGKRANKAKKMIKELLECDISEES